MFILLLLYVNCDDYLSTGVSVLCHHSESGQLCRKECGYWPLTYTTLMPCRLLSNHHEELERYNCADKEGERFCHLVTNSPQKLCGVEGANNMVSNITTLPLEEHTRSNFHMLFTLWIVTVILATMCIIYRLRRSARGDLDGYERI